MTTETGSVRMVRKGDSIHITTPSGRSYYACVGEIVTTCKTCKGEGRFDSCFDCGNRGYHILGVLK